MFKCSVIRKCSKIKSKSFSSIFSTIRLYSRGPSCRYVAAAGTFLLIEKFGWYSPVSFQETGHSFSFFQFRKLKLKNEKPVSVTKFRFTRPLFSFRFFSFSLPENEKLKRSERYLTQACFTAGSALNRKSSTKIKAASIGNRKIMSSPEVQKSTLYIYGEMEIFQFPAQVVVDGQYGIAFWLEKRK